MAKVIRRHLATPLESELPVRDRRPCKYKAYVPDTLSDSSIGLDAPGCGRRGRRFGIGGNRWLGTHQEAPLDAAAQATA